jgi:hypothetical protein
VQTPIQASEAAQAPNEPAAADRPFPLLRVERSPMCVSGAYTCFDRAVMMVGVHAAVQGGRSGLIAQLLPLLLLLMRVARCCWHCAVLQMWLG